MVGTPVTKFDGRREYVIRIAYREPTYEAGHGARPRPYGALYRLRATSTLDAHERAVREFREMERNSSVGWVRQIVSVEVSVAGDELNDQPAPMPS
jgi:hypothetical protein